MHMGGTEFSSSKFVNRDDVAKIDAYDPERGGWCE
jgi:hypothetical protein